MTVRVKLRGPRENPAIPRSNSNRPREYPAIFNQNRNRSGENLAIFEVRVTFRESPVL